MTYGFWHFPTDCQLWPSCTADGSNTSLLWCLSLWLAAALSHIHLPSGAFPSSSSAPVKLFMLARSGWEPPVMWQLTQLVPIDLREYVAQQQQQHNLLALSSFGLLSKNIRIFDSFFQIKYLCFLFTRVCKYVRFVLLVYLWYVLTKLVVV